MVKLGIGILAVCIFLSGLFLTSGILQILIQLFSLSLLIFFTLFFLTSLFGNRTPIITRYAVLMSEQISENEIIYTRKVTWVWSAFLIGLCGLKLSYLCAGYDLFALGRVELLFYLGSTLLFVSEFYFRQLLFIEHRGSSLSRFLIHLPQISFKDVWNYDRGDGV